MASSRRSRASQRAAANHDIVLELVKHLDESALHPFLRTSKAFAAAAMPRLYRRLTVDHTRPSLFLDLSPGSPPRSPGVVAEESTSDSKSVEAWTKRAAWTYVRELSIRIHGESACPTRLYSALPALPNLEHIHLSGGETTLDMGRLCAYHSCPLLDNYRLAPIRRLTIRKLEQLPDFPLVRHLTILLRPCQLPFEPRGGVTHCAGTFRPLGGIRSLDLVFWDERHAHRIDWVHHPATAQPPIKGYPAIGAVRLDRNSRPFKTKGCAYCDQSGCLRHSPNAPKQIPGLVYNAARWTGVRDVAVWNARETVEENQWWDSQMTAEECWKAIRAEAGRGRKQRREDARGDAGSRERQVEMTMENGTSEERTDEAVGGSAGKEAAGRGGVSRSAETEETDDDNRVEVKIRSGTEWVAHAAADMDRSDWNADMEYWAQKS